MSSAEILSNAVKSGHLLPAAADNIRSWQSVNLPDWARRSIDELVAGQAWAELNDRFYRYLEFGTGGMRGRTMGLSARLTNAVRSAKAGHPLMPL